MRMKVFGALCVLVALRTRGLDAVQGPAVDCLTLPSSGLAHVPIEIRLNANGTALTAGQALVFVSIRREISSDIEAASFERLLEPDWRTSFGFEGSGTYTVRTKTTDHHHWPPDGKETGGVLAGCAEQQIRIIEDPRPDFDGVRSHAWVAWRVPGRAEFGGSLFVRRLGLAASVEGAPVARDLVVNRWTGGVDARWRGARGYIGGGARWVPDAPPGQHHFRPVFVIGEELPNFRQHPMWFALDIRGDELQPKFWNGLSATFVVRFDLTPNRP